MTGSPWKVDVRSSANVTIVGSGIQFVPVGRLATFEVRTGISGGSVIVNVTCKWDIVI